MKNKILYAFIFALFTAVLSSCKKEDNSISSSSPTIDASSWKITYYLDQSKDETFDFSSYTFSFKQNGTLIATSSASTVNGSWSEITDDDNGVQHKLVISLGATSPLNRLNDDWLITSRSTSTIELKDDSNNNEVLHFSKL